MTYKNHKYEESDEGSILSHFKKVSINELDDYLNEYIHLTYEEGIELAHYYIRREINSIQVNKEQKTRWLSLNDKYRNAFLSDVRINLFKIYTGSGKTYTSVRWVELLTKLAPNIEGFVILSSEYEHGVDEIERIIARHGSQVQYIRYESKRRICHQRELFIYGNIKVGNLLDNQVSINKYCEKKCKRFETCLYWANNQQIFISKEDGGIKNLVSVSHQLGYFIPHFLYHVKSIVLIIDEDFSDAIKMRTVLTRNVLQKNIKFLKYVLSNINEENKDCIDVINCFMELFTFFITTLNNPEEPLDQIKLYELVVPLSIYIDERDNTHISDLSERAFDYLKDKGIKPFQFLFGNFANFLDNYNYEEFFEEDNNLNNHLENWLNFSLQKRINRKTNIPTIIIFYYDKSLFKFLLRGIKIEKMIINDATADEVIVENLTGNTESIAVYEEDWNYKKVEVHKLEKIVKNRKDDRKYAHYPKSSFFHQTTFYYLMKDVKIILERHIDDKVLIVARDVEAEHLDFIGIAMSEYIQTFTHFDMKFETYPLSGTNEYSDYDVVIILGRPELRKAVIKKQSTLIGMKPKEYRDNYSETKIRQAYGRILRGDKLKYIYILTGFEFDLKFPKNKIKIHRSHSKLQQYLKKEIKSRKENENYKTTKQKIMDYLKDNNYITINECTKILNISRYKSDKLLKDLKTKKILKSKIIKTNKTIVNPTIYFI